MHFCWVEYGHFIIHPLLALLAPSLLDQWSDKVLRWGHMSEPGKPGVDYRLYSFTLSWPYWLPLSLTGDPTGCCGEVIWVSPGNRGWTTGIIPLLSVGLIGSLSLWPMIRQGAAVGSYEWARETGGGLQALYLYSQLALLAPSLFDRWSDRVLSIHLQ